MKIILFFVTMFIMSINSYAVVASSMTSSISVDTRLWELNIAASPGGSVTGSGSYYRQATVSVQATALPGYSFDSWSGNASGSNNPISITMDGHKTISAEFVEEFILIPAGTFTMGRTSGELYTDAPPVTVTLSSFYIGKNEVTKQLWVEVYNWATSNGYNDFTVFLNTSKPSNHPVDTISWFDAVKWCNARSQKEGLIPCYNVNGSIMKIGTTAPTVNWAANGYRLPTEAEWEKAARGGVSGKRFPWGGDTISHAHANYRSNIGFHPTFSNNTVSPYTSPVGSFAENGYGLNDMAGNVWEWCWDWYGATSYVNDAADPRGIGSGAIYRVSRGGSWNENDLDCSAASRGAFGPMMAGANMGFRIARNAQNGNTVARDDQDNDGILDVREIHQLGTNPNLVDSNSNGLSDTYELLFQGNIEPFSPRVGDRVRYDLNRFGYQGTYRLAGRLPAGLTFNSLTRIIEGKLAATAKTSTVNIQFLDGTTVTRSIPLTIPVLPFPAALTGTWQALIYNEEGVPQGMLTTTLSSPGTWTASLDLAGATALRSARGTFDLKPAEENVNLSLRFAATTTLPQLDLALDIFGSSSLCEGDSSFGKIKGFRLAKAGEFPAVTTTMTILFDHGDHDGFAIPAGYGFATGSITPTGTIALTGQLGDSQPLRTSMRLGATGQAILWIKPHKNRASKLGGVISLHDTGVIPLTNASLNESELWWHRVPDATELSYPAGFAPISVRPRVQRHIVPLNATGLSQILGLANQAYTDVDFSGAGLAMLENNLSFPSLLTMDSAYKLLPQYPLGKPPIAWAGTIAPRTGGFTGTLTLATAIGDIRVGRITAAGIVFPLDEESGAVGAGVIKIPTTTRTGAFRTGRLVLRP